MTSGIYTIMITLAIGGPLFYFAQQVNYDTSSTAFQGFPRRSPPLTAFGVDRHRPVPFYYPPLASVLGRSRRLYFFVKYQV